MIHHVFANKRNIGDWLSARAIQGLLAPLPVREHLCDEPFVDATLAELARAPGQDFIIIGGGGLFMDYFTGFWRGFRELAGRTPYGIWGVGYCDSKQQPTRGPVELLAAIVRGARICVVRDELTRQHLAGCDLPAATPCPSLSLFSPATARGRGLLHISNYASVGEAVYEALVARAREHALQTSRPYRELNHQIPPGNETALHNQLQCYRDADVVLSSGLHGCILGVGMGRPVVAVSGDRKIDAFMHWAGLGAWVCDAARLDDLPRLLATAAQQPSAAALVAQAQQQHRVIAQRVRREAGCA